MQTVDSVLKDTFGFEAFRPGQQDIIEQIIAGKNMLAVMPTGAGKSLCYQIPALVFKRPTVVVSPLVALMDNQVAGLRQSGVDVAVIHSGQSREQNVQQWRSVTHGGAKLLYLSPERLMSQRMLSAMAQLKPAMFVVDEAHCVSKWGPAFRPEYDDLQNLKTLFPDTVIAAFTATADETTREDIAGKLFGGQGQTIVHGFDRPNLELAVMPKANRKAQLAKLMESVKGQSGIVYCLSRKNTEQIAQELNDQGHTALPYHAGMDAAARFDNQERFMAEDGIVMVATIAFGMGIDKPDIRFVFHTSLPSSLEAYYQEIGRAGRDGHEAVTAMIFGFDDVRMRRQFISDDGSDSEHQAREHKRLDALLGYCEAAKCRRQVLLTYFGETAKPCGNCDICLNPPKLIDATDNVRALLAGVKDTGQRFGQSHVIDVVRGAQTQKVAQFGHGSLPSYGQGKHMGKPYLLALVRQAVAMGLLDMDMSRYGALVLKAAGLDVLEGRERFECKDIVSRAAQSKAARKAKVSAVESELSERDRELLVSLKARRSELARAKSVPAYVIFSDASLMGMARMRPANEAQMLSVSGVGAVKFERYGDAFLELIAQAS